jgi:DNA-binding IclR family transcriptional regulator
MSRQIDPPQTEPPVSESIILPEVVGAQLLARALNLLLILRDRVEPMTAAALGNALEQPMSNTYRLIQQLELSGLVERRGRDGFVLGLRFLDFGRVVGDWIERVIAADALPIMRSLTRETGETSLLTMRTGLNAICVLSVDSPRPIPLSFAPGRIIPLYRSASGRILMPWLNARLVDRVLKDMAPYVTGEGERIDAAVVRAQLKEIRETGYCVTSGEVDAGATGDAVPVLSSSDRLLAGLTVAGQRERFSERHITELVSKLRTATSLIAKRWEGRDDRAAS